MIRLGIVGCNFGRIVQLPALRADPRCEVIALAGSDLKRTAELARATNVPKAYGDWRALVEDDDVQAVAISTMPALQAHIAVRALPLEPFYWRACVAISTWARTKSLERQSDIRRF